MEGSSSEDQRPGKMTTEFGYGSGSFGGGNQNPQSHLAGQLQSFESAPEIYNLTAGMEMIGFQSKGMHQEGGESTAVMWRELFSKTAATYGGGGGGGGGSQSSGNEMNEPTSSEFYHHDFRGVSNDEAALIVPQDPPSPWSHHQSSGRSFISDDPSLSCVFPCEGNERPSQGLSLSLSSSNPSAIGLQHFELRQHGDLRFGGASSSRSLNPPAPPSHVFQAQSILRNCRYLGPAQELLNEFCSLNTKEITENSLRSKGQKPSELQEEMIIKKQSLYSLDLLELQRRKTKLLQMLVEVDRRYRYYCDQMRAVVSSFEAVAGLGAATVYSAMASKAMSRHFRCLRDGIVSQIRATKKAIGDKDAAAPGTTKGETPRLRLLDQTLRQQRALQQMSLMDSHPWRPQRGLPERAVSVLRAWLFEHFLHPYPCDVDKHILARQTGLSRSQVSNWFINARVRLWKPMVEEMYLEELKESEAMNASVDGGGNMDCHQYPQRMEDQKPTQDQLVRIDTECLTSIISGNQDKGDLRKNKGLLLNEQHHNPTAFINNYGAMQIDFSSYGHSHPAAVSYLNDGAGGIAGFQGNGGAGGGVSLTLGLHQHGGASGGMGFPPTAGAAQSSLFYSREQMEECHSEQYSLLDSENQTLPYRNLMGAQLLHDLAG